MSLLTLTSFWSGFIAGTGALYFGAGTDILTYKRITKHMPDYKFP